MPAIVRSYRFLAIGTLAIASLALAVYFATSTPKIDQKIPESTSANFRDVAPEVGIKFRMAYLPGEQGEKFKINLYDHGCGVAIADFDGDGLEDIFFLNQLGPNALYRNKGDGTFEDVAVKAGVALGDRICVAATFADYDNDGFPDLYITSTRGGNVLLKNLGNGTFKDVTKEAGLTWIGHSQSAIFFDHDNDGFLDLFLTNTAKWTLKDLEPGGRYFPGVAELMDLAVSPKEHNVFYRNNGDGTFTNVTEKAGLKGLGWGGDAAAFDFDEDGNTDLLVTNMFGRSQLYRNNGNGTFTDVTRAVLGRTSFGAVGCKVFDFNNDGKLDLLIVDMHSDMWTGYAPLERDDVRLVEKKKFPHLSGPMTIASYKGLSGAKLEDKLADVFQVPYNDVVFGNTLFLNQGNGKFAEVSERANVETFWPWGVATGDFNNDGYEDVFLPSGMGGHLFFYWENQLLMNNGDGTFTERARQEGIEPPREGIYQQHKIADLPSVRSSRAAAVADFRKDGRLDIVVNNFNDQAYFFQNHFPKKNYVSFQLQGTKSNRDAIGALVHIHIGKEVMVRQVQGAGGYLSQSSRKAHFGLGDRTTIDRVDIRWPSGTRQRIDAPAINRLHLVTEAAGS